ncbi:MAG: lipoyl(octanoyl) transferase LipB [Gammaproteobacteria bacterium]|nr:lipoyl(octanoyl) transferase LipB [Gammaproteobacteria bacterium]
MTTRPIIYRDLGRTAYAPVFAEMKAFTAERTDQTLDEIWFTEHDPVFTQGQAGKAEHVLATGDIPVVQTDRGGQVTYHGPGQITGYLLFDLNRAGLGVRALVSGIEEGCVRTLADFGLAAAPRPDAPGVYIYGTKIASLGLRVRRGCSYHGLALNVAMDLLPFNMINPCGMAGMQMTDMRTFVPGIDIEAVRSRLLGHLLAIYGLNLHTPDSSLPDAV